MGNCDLVIKSATLYLNNLEIHINMEFGAGVYTVMHPIWESGKRKEPADRLHE